MASGEPTQISVSQDRRAMLDQTGSTVMPMSFRVVSTTDAMLVWVPLQML